MKKTQVKIGESIVDLVISNLVPEGKVLFMRYADAEKLIKQIEKMEQILTPKNEEKNGGEPKSPSANKKEIS